MSGNDARVFIQSEVPERGHLHPALAKYLSHSVLVLGDDRGVRRIVLKPQALGDGSGDDCGVFIDWYDCVDWKLFGELLSSPRLPSGLK